MDVADRLSASLPGSSALRADPGAVVAWLVPAALIVYIALQNGGYDEVERGEVGIVVWTLLLAGSVVGVLPVAGTTRQGRALFALLGAFAAWTALSLSWTDSVERSSSEVARVAGYLGVFGLALAVQGGERWRHMLNGITVGVAIVCGLAVLSRLEPSLFPARLTGAFLPGIEIESRLAYPLNYSSALGALAAIGLPLLLASTGSARTIFVQALAAGALPMVALTLYLTNSNLSVAAAGAGLIVFLCLAPDRLPKLATFGVSAAGSAVLFAAVEQREGLERGLPTPAASEQGDEMLVMIIVVCVGVALLQAAIGLAARYARRPAWMRVPRTTARLVAGVAAAALVIVVGSAGLLGGASEAWDSFKDRDGTSGADDQILNLSSSGRYQFWESAVEANATDPLKGIGPGTFEMWWAREGTEAGYVRDAHSLFVETLAELGIVGILLITGFSLAVLVIGAVRASRAPPSARAAIAAASGGCAAFVTAALVDWVWEIAVLPIAFFGLAAIAIAAGAASPDARRPGSEPAPWRRYGDCVILAALSLAALYAIVIPLSATSALEDSRAAAAEGDLDTALAEARNAKAIQPYAASLVLQEALVLERLGELQAAVGAAREAVDDEPGHWQAWLVLSRLEQRSGDATASEQAYRRARDLNPRSPIFAILEE